MQSIYAKLLRKVKYLFYLFILTIMLFSTSEFASSKTTTIKKGNKFSIKSDENSKLGFSVRIEHVAFNVPEPVSSVNWYTKNLGMKIMRKGTPPTYTYFIADSGEHMIMELFHNINFVPLNLPEISFMALHYAFMVKDIETVKEKLLDAGATLAQDISTTPTGDKVLMLRDPWGIPLQFVQRVQPLINYTGIRPEHIAFNVPDARAKAKWFVENLGMKIVKESGAPNFGLFMIDPTGNMMVELYQNIDYPMLDFHNLSYNSMHFAFMVNNLSAVKKKLLSNGASFEVEETTPAGDKVLMLRDPWGQPIQFIERANPMLK
jgi:catechol 2,3-dioxygenase-like lactoylglutathione lyase family enzyme